MVEYHCESFWPQKTTARGSPTNTELVTQWLMQMATVGWELVTAVQVGDEFRPSETLYYFRRIRDT